MIHIRIHTTHTYMTTHTRTHALSTTAHHMRIYEETSTTDTNAAVQCILRLVLVDVMEQLGGMLVNERDKAVRIGTCNRYCQADVLVVHREYQDVRYSRNARLSAAHCLLDETFTPTPQCSHSHHDTDMNMD